MKVGDLVWYNEDIETLIFDFNLPERFVTYAMHTWGKVVEIANGGTHAVVSYEAHLSDGAMPVIILLPVSSLKEDTDHIMEHDELARLHA